MDFVTFVLLIYNNVSSVTELCIKTKEKFRLFIELKISNRACKQTSNLCKGLDPLQKLEQFLLLKSYEFIFDAKYKIDTSQEYIQSYGSVTELCIKTKEEFRLFLELKRLYNETSIEGHNIIGAESGIKAFNLDDINIVVNDDMIMSIADETVIKVSKDGFMKKPIKSIKELLRK